MTLKEFIEKNPSAVEEAAKCKNLQEFKSRLSIFAPTNSPFIILHLLKFNFFISFQIKIIQDIASRVCKHIYSNIYCNIFFLLNKYN